MSYSQHKLCAALLALAAGLAGCAGNGEGLNANGLPSRAIVITPTAPLLPGTYRVTARRTGGGVLADLNAQVLGSDYSFTFTVDTSP
jgi:hypothetical protein